MTHADKIREYLKAHPGATNRDITTATGVSPNTVSSFTHYFFVKGELIRWEAGRTLSNVPYYAYELVGEGQEFDNAKNVSHTRKNVSHTRKNATKKIGDSMLGLDDMVEQLASRLAQQVAVKLRDKIAAELADIVASTALPEIKQAALMEQAPSAAEPAIKLPAIEQKKPKKPHVLICGLLPQQAGLISQEFGEVFDLRFWKDEGIGRLKDLVRNADYSITFSSKLGHHVEETIKSAGAPVTRVMGGMTSLRDVLTDIYCGVK